MEEQNTTSQETPKLVRVTRLDSINLDGKEKTYFTDEGYLIDHPILTSVGIFEYKQPDGGIRRELRLPEHVFKKESLESYRGKPIIITHEAGEVTKDNVSTETIGTILSDGYQDGDDVRAEITIHDTDRMKESGFKELSLGYNLDLIEEEGEWHGEHYDAIQTNIAINHLALVAKARAGDQARLNIDGADVQETENGSVSEPTLEGGKVVMKDDKTTPTANGDELTPEELKEAIEAFKAKKAAGNDCTDGADTQTKPDDVKPEDNTDCGDNKDCGDKTDCGDGQDCSDNKDNETVDSTDGQDCAETKEDNFDGSTPQGILDFVSKNKESRDKDPVKALTQADADIDMLTACVEKLLSDKAKEEAKDCADKENKDGSEDESKSMNNDSADVAELVNREVNRRLSAIRIGDKLHMDGLENMDTKSARIAIIKRVHPDIRLDGQSDSYLDAMYDLTVGEVNKRKDVNYQRQQMVQNAPKTEARADSSQDNRPTAASAREKMLQREGGNE